MKFSRTCSILVALSLLLASVAASAAGLGRGAVNPWGPGPGAKNLWGVISGEVYWVTAAHEDWEEGLECAIPPDDPLQTHSSAFGFVYGLGWIEMKSVHCTDVSGNGMARIWSNGYGGVNELILSYEFEQVLTVPPPLVVVDSEWVIVGGSGGFDGAIGKLTGSAFLQPMIMIDDNGNPQPDISVSWPAKWTIDGVAHGSWLGIGW